MNQLLENPSEIETPLAPVELDDAVVAEKGAVLLLEDDPSFQAVIADFLTESGYTVVAVRNGAEGIREALARDFAVIICDMMMPTLPGEMFYRAIARTRPHLSNRFLFMTGYRNGDKTSEFIASINGFVLRKPFHLDDLLDAIAFAEIRSTHLSVFHGDDEELAGAQELPSPEAASEGIASPAPAPTVTDKLLPSVPSAPMAPAPLSRETAFRAKEAEAPEIAPAPEPTGGAENLSEPAVATGPGRVLLVDDDSSFNDIIRDFLVESGFTVVAVQSGGAGVREVLAGDFALVLCDLMMPALPGEAFYRAVERIRPELCGRFIFMSGYRGDDKTCDFIKRVNGYVLKKPFLLQDLLDAIMISEARSLSKIRRASPQAPVVTLNRPPPNSVPAAATLHQSQSRVTSEAPQPAPHAPSAPLRLPAAIPAPPRPSFISRAFPLAALALFVVLGVHLGFWSPRARDRAMTAASERLELEAEWKLVLVHLKGAEEVRNECSSLQKLADRLADETRIGGWTRALQVVAKMTGPEITTRGIAAQGMEGPRGGCKILIQGIAIGRNRREIAEKFYDDLRREAERSITCPVVTKLSRFQDEPDGPSVPDDQRRASFNMTLNIESDEPRNREGSAAK